MQQSILEHSAVHKVLAQQNHVVMRQTVQTTYNVLQQLIAAAATAVAIAAAARTQLAIDSVAYHALQPCSELLDII
jgi:hypothetical protein